MDVSSAPSGSPCYRLLQARVARDSCYTEVMAISQIDRLEPRWPVILALVAVTVIYMALPKELIVGPTWLLPVLVVTHFVYCQSGDPENSECFLFRWLVGLFGLSAALTPIRARYLFFRLSAI